MNNSSNNKRIAKNTFFLYIRMMLTMVISLYTSRLVLNTLGVNDFGIYNVVGGLVSTFSLISATMTTTISRFLTFEIGRGDKDRLNLVFSTSLNVQILISIIIVVLAETIGFWFLCNKMEIPHERMNAALWVYQCSLVSFVFNVISVPYSAVVIARERMGAYAYLSIMEVLLKLVVVFLLLVSMWDKLISYAILLMAISIFMQLIYVIYCGRHFEESKYNFKYEPSIVKEMLQFSGYNYLGAAAYILRYQGLNVLTNLFFGVAINAARGIAASVESSVSQFVGNFTMALNPPITKAYARNDMEYMNSLVCNGAKYSFLLMMTITLPIFFEAPIILKIWLKIVPDYTILFLRLTLIIVLIDVLSNTITTAILATGDIKFPQLVLSPVMMMVFPITYVLFKIGCPAYSAYVVFGIIVALRIIIELFFLRKLVGLSPWRFVGTVIKPSVCVLIAALLPFILQYLMEESFLRLIIVLSISLLWSFVCVFTLGITKEERVVVRKKSTYYFKKIRNHGNWDY